MDRVQNSVTQVYHSYWMPLTQFLRRLGFTSEDAQDLTQGFFLKLLRNEGLQHLDRTKGRLRDYLCVGLRRFALDETDKRQRRPVQYMASLPDDVAKVDVPEGFDRDWAKRLLDLSCQRMLHRLRQGRDAKVNEVLFLFLLQNQGDSSLSELGSSLGLSEAATKMRLMRLRQIWRQVLRDEISQTVPDPADIDPELRHLIRVLEFSHDPSLDPAQRDGEESLTH